jgi:NADPH:quinone reductase-like Zn-dependent oxidoreductase
MPPRVPDLLVKVRGTALNRATLKQRQRFYSPPSGASPILRRECADEVIGVSAEVKGWRRGDRAMALLGSLRGVGGRQLRVRDPCSAGAKRWRPRRSPL